MSEKLSISEGDGGVRIRGSYSRVRTNVTSSPGWLPSFIPVRVIFTVTAFFGLLHLYMLRMNLSVAVVAMSKPIIHNSTANGTASTGCPVPERTNDTVPDTIKHGDFDWDEKTQSFILASFFYGYVFTQFAGGRLADMFGGKRLIGGGIFFTSIMTMLTPITAELGGWIALSVLRFFMGIVGGTCFPAIQSMMSVWIPKTELSVSNSAVFTGPFIGTVLGMVIAGALADTSFLQGWPANFYVFGVSGLIWCVMWYFLVSDSPDKHPWISEEERNYIINGRGTIVAGKKVPWREIMTSVPFWALIVTQSTHSFGQYLLMTKLPAYMDTILGYSLTQNGFLSGAPYIILTVVCILTGYIADTFRTKQWAKVTTIRKFCDGLSSFGPGLCLVAVTFDPCNRAMAVFWFWLAIVLIAPQNSGWNVVCIDMAPAFSGTIYGFANTIANTTGFLAPLMVGWLTGGQDNIWTWGHVFYISCAIYSIGGLIFIIWGSAEVQPWAVVTEADLKAADKLKNGSSHESNGKDHSVDA